MRNPLSAYLKSYPLRDRGMLLLDGRSAVFYAVFNGLAIPLAGIAGRTLGMDDRMLALLTIASYAGLLLNLWIGHLSERGRRVGWVAVPGIASRAAVALAGAAAGPRGFLAAMGTHNFVSTFSGPAYMSLMRSNYSDGNRGRAMSGIRVLIQIVSALCAAAGGWFMDRAPWAFRVVFIVAGAAGILSSILFLKVKDRDRPIGPAGAAIPRQGFRESLVSLWQDKSFMLYMVVFFFVGMPDKIVAALEPIRLVDGLGIGYGKAGLIIGAIPTAAAILGYVILSKALRRRDPFALLAVTAFLASSRYLSFAIASSPEHLIPSSLLCGIANAGWDLLPLFTIILFAKPEKLGLYSGFHQALIGVRGIIGPILGSWLYSGFGVRIESMYWIAFGVSIFSVIFLAVFILLRKSGRIRLNITQ